MLIYHQIANILTTIYIFIHGAHIT